MIKNIKGGQVAALNVYRRWLRKPGTGYAIPAKRAVSLVGNGSAWGGSVL